MVNNNPHIVFMGTPEFAIPSMLAIHHKYGLKAIVTLPDTPAGRGQNLRATAVKVAALQNNIPVLTPQSLKDPSFIQELQNLQPDIIIVVAFKILPKSVYNIASIGTFNIHGSLLPKYRGAAPIQWSLIHGDTETGLTTFLLNDSVDTGNILVQKKYTIPENTSYGELYQQLMTLSVSIALETCDGLIHHTIVPKVQDETASSPAPKIFKKHCHITFEKSSKDIKNLIHGLNPIPGAFVSIDNKQVKLLRAHHYTGNEQVQCGQFLINTTEFLLGCSDGILSIVELQIEGKPKMKTTDFLRGYRGILHGIVT
jgi:methionyl-tRNA formyltransferase